jgi:hypothetical protein
VALLDADSDTAPGRFADEVETVRSGYILARDAKTYNLWRRDVDRRTGRVSGRNLGQLARDFGGTVGTGGSVVRGGFEFRN